jgi:hypothetical protein
MLTTATLDIDSGHMRARSMLSVSTLDWKGTHMPSLIVRSRTQLVRFWRIDAPLSATALAMTVLLVACGVGLWLDPRTILGAPAWLKPAKFAASIAVYTLTLVWLFSYIPSHVRTRRIVGWATAVAMLTEMVIICGQSFRGTTSHFNVSTPLNAVLWTLMGVAIVLQTLASVAVAVALFRQPFADGALGWAVRLGMVITIAGAFLGGVMSRPTPEQLDELRAGQPSVSGAHTVGAADGGPGIAATGWSREHGDLRVAHFMGLHALQVLPLGALALRRTRVSRVQRKPLVFTLAGSYFGLIGIVLWQALRGQALIAPDASTLGALSVWAALTAVLVRHALGASAEPARATATAS